MEGIQRDMTSKPLRPLRIIKWILGATFVLAGGWAAIAQDHGLYGGHPAHGAPDPYLQTRNVSGGDCCHGQDCQRFYGDPKRVTSETGIKGWQFGEYFVADDKLVDVRTLPIEERGFHHICVLDVKEGSYEGGAAMSSYKLSLCGYVAMGV